MYSKDILDCLKPCQSLAFHGSHRSEPGKFAPVRTGEVCTGSSQKCNQFPWFDPVSGRSSLLPIKYKFSVEYCLPFCRLLLYVSKVGPQWLRMFVIQLSYNPIILLINEEVSSFGKLHTIFVGQFGSYVVTDKVQHQFLPPQPKDCFKRHEPGVSMVRISTECEPQGAHWVSSNKWEEVLTP